MSTEIYEQRYGRWWFDELAEQHRSREKALAALREGSKVLGPKPLGQNDDDQRREASVRVSKERIMLDAIGCVQLLI